MAWNKRVMTFKTERKFEVKSFRSDAGGTAIPGTVHNYPTKTEVVEAEFEVEIEIDFDAVFMVMGERASKRKGGRCVDGLVKVKARKKREISRKVEPIKLPDYWKEVPAP